MRILILGRCLNDFTMNFEGWIDSFIKFHKVTKGSFIYLYDSNAKNGLTFMYKGLTMIDVKGDFDNIVEVMENYQPKMSCDLIVNDKATMKFMTNSILRLFNSHLVSNKTTLVIRDLKPKTYKREFKYNVEDTNGYSKKLTLNKESFKIKVHGLDQNHTTYIIRVVPEHTIREIKAHLHRYHNISLYDLHQAIYIGKTLSNNTYIKNSGLFSLSSVNLVHTLGNSTRLSEQIHKVLNNKRFVCHTGNYEKYLPHKYNKTKNSWVTKCTYNDKLHNNISIHI